MRMGLFFPCAVLALASFARAADVAKPAGTTPSSDPATSWLKVLQSDPAVLQEPDHLVPVDPHPGEWSTRYTADLRSRLKLDRYFFAQMVVRPSFSGEYAVQLHGSEDEGHLPFELATKFFLTWSAAGESIWYASPENNEAHQQKAVTVTTTTAELPKPLATRIAQMWRRMLLQTHYPEEEATGLDGVVWEFGAWGRYGETWSPSQRKSPLLLIELGDSLIRYCKAAPAERTAAAKEIEKKAAQLEEYLNKHRAK
jgi:hypothetical protein